MHPNLVPCPNLLDPPRRQSDPLDVYLFLSDLNAFYLFCCFLALAITSSTMLTEVAELGFLYLNGFMILGQKLSVFCHSV